ncbi:MAG: hypothetical protein J5671_06495 [Bacteroidaceae bacterium]|nr:hypothetical protein [Bacteroidaceae bacterium]
MKRIVLFLILSFSQFLVLNTSAAGKDRETRKVLDATAERIRKAGALSIQFTATSLLGNVSQGSTSGTMDISGRKFFMKTEDMLTWFDGKTQWTMEIGDNEVDMTEPTGTELQMINPYAFVNIYKQGFNYKMKQGTLSNGKQGYKIILNADNAKQDIREMFLEVDKQYNPVRISIRQGKKQWVRLVVNRFSGGQSFSADHFTFPKSKYPKAEIIDLR